MTVPVFTMACEAYDRMQPLRDGTVRLRGGDINFIELPVEETFFRMLRFNEFDIAELSLSSYTMTLSRGAPYVAVPVFPSRAFRHSGIYVRRDSPISDPAELVGATVGVPEYQITASVWIRGILAEHHGLAVDAVRYRTGGLNEPGRVEKLRVDLPPGVEVQPIGPDQTLSQMLLDKDIDAIYSARNPGPVNARDSGVRRLFADPVSEERRFHARTGVFPIMHTLVIRREVYERNRWLAREVVKACEAAKTVALAGIAETATLRYALPWLWAEVEQLRADFGDDWWPYGLEANRTTLETFLRYHHEQGLSPQRHEPEELFAPESLAAVAV